MDHGELNSTDTGTESPTWNHIFAPPGHPTTRLLFTIAWRSHGQTNEDLINTMRTNGLITSDRVAEVGHSLTVDPATSGWWESRVASIQSTDPSHDFALQAMKKVDRKQYVQIKSEAYMDSPSPIGFKGMYYLR